ncbi:unnamed protein product [Rotaria socialis]|uniref:CCHC-type domain-containing protein n=1 Tax=Rotaria socialis TaxID=392032 RepID=A0A818AJL3_9BILA|nr:unnamed protein product [Rotaria socialis]CAF3385710.1 unnamed protein product [Rotaria socialis]CAF3406779.1 unnamed protein product [Rotaria socialis]CAF4308883.1 unnamed protein product [Rotaria socialis]CAF4396925.1 unnamed protein product [Rotaria socialis]
MSLTSKSSVSSQDTTRSIIVTKVSLGLDEDTILRSLGHNYVSIDKVSRRYARDGQPIGSIQVDFKSDQQSMKIIEQGYILIDGKQYPARGFWPLICHRCQQEGHYASNCPKNPLTEERFNELIKMQQEQFAGMMNSFEAKWNARLSNLKTSSANSNMEKLVPIFKDLNTVCQQFFQQNGQMQQQLGSMASRVQGVQTKSNNQ